MQKKYIRCSVNLFDMKNKFKSEKLYRHITTPAYYRLYLPNLLSNIEKIIYLDGDTLTFDDLKKNV